MNARMIFPALAALLLLTGTRLAAQDRLADYALQVDQGNAAAVLPALRTFTENHADDLHAWIILGKAYIIVERFDSARIAAERVLATDPGNESASRMLLAIDEARNARVGTVIGNPDNAANPSDAGRVDPEAPPGNIEYDEAPVPTKQVMPKYPEDAMRDNLEGIVYLNVWITAEGTVKKAEVLKSDAAVLNQAAIDAVRQWEFTPAKKDGKPIAVWVTIPFKFRLKTDGSK